jgi:hypothetical protein
MAEMSRAMACGSRLLWPLFAMMGAEQVRQEGRP